MKNRIIIATVLIVLGASVAYVVAREHESHDGHDHNEHSDSIERDSHEGHDHDEHEGVETEEHEDHDGQDHVEVESDEHDGHDHGSVKAIGKGKAIEEVDDNKGFRLSKEAIKTLKIKLKSVKGKSFNVEKSALVASKNIKGIYIYRNGYFKLFSVSINKEMKKSYSVNLSNVRFGDQVVISGVPLLRVSDIYSTDTSEYGHAH